MIGKSHQMVGFATVYTFAVFAHTPYLNGQTIIAGLLCITLGSLTPDLDSQENRLYNLIPFGHKILSEVGERAFGKHRTISHSLIGVIIAWIVSKWLIFMIPVENGFNLSALWYSYIIALISHLAADSVTKEGIPLFWPLKYKFGFPPFRFMRMKTGSFVEVYLVRCIIVLWVVGLTIVQWGAVKIMLGWS